MMKKDLRSPFAERRSGHFRQSQNGAVPSMLVDFCRMADRHADYSPLSELYYHAPIFPVKENRGMIV